MPKKMSKTKTGANGSAGCSYETLRAKLIHRGLTLRSFAIRKGYSVQTVYSAAKRKRHGVKSVQIIKELEELTA